ncbi:hypothetical protein HN51_058624 [Arachis hypogaea]|uniref:probable carboxylesterase 7 n=1 Tax=Arachis hypogaea TaxID=3818 RepID=UPI000DED9EFC|nr:probable carboxylesterase 7 [Arachis hypogaea]QHN81940.1 putative carboxylesterase [Arachis hypogaea]
MATARCSSSILLRTTTTLRPASAPHQQNPSSTYTSIIHHSRNLISTATNKTIHTTTMASTARWSTSLLSKYSVLRPRTPILPPALAPQPQPPLSTYSTTVHHSISLGTATIKKKHAKRRVEATMEEKEVSLEFPFFRVYKDGGVESLHSTPVFYPPCDVKDAVISSDPCAPVSARIFLPKTPNPNNKLPVLLFFHGSGFCASSAFTEEYSNHVAAIANEAKVLAVSVEYAKFPARSPPECYEDAWRSLQWVVSHKGGDGPEPWLNDLADLQRVFIAGSGTGGNLSHWVASLVGKTVLPRGVSVEGAILVHPFFGGIGDDDQWLFMCKEKNGPEDPRLKPTVEDLQSLGCKRVLVCVAEKDPLLVAGRNYVTALKKSGWSGSVELVENQGLGHCEHVYKPYEDSSREVLKKIASFINEKNCCC